MSATGPRNLNNTALMSLSRDDLIYLHIGGRRVETTSDFHVTSCIETIEENMRSAAQNDRSKIFAPILCAFAILDQIGTCYADNRLRQSQKQNGVQRSLHYFCGIADDTDLSLHLYMLRNGMVHDASMTSQRVDRQKNVLGSYIFRYVDNLSTVAIPSKRPWNGSSSDICDDTFSYVDRSKLIEMASSAISTVREMFYKNRIHLDVLLPEDEIRNRFLLWIPKN